MSYLSKGKKTAHDPPPTHLSASHASLTGPSSSAGGQAPPSASAAFMTPTSLASLTSPTTTGSAVAGGISHLPSQAGPSSHITPSGLNINLPVPVPSLRSRESTRTTDRTDALWAEMQATLEAVELTAGGGGGGGGGGTGGDGASAHTSTARVFGPDHERKLDELRAAQIALAQAWARSEADDAIETTAAAAGASASVGGGLGAGDGAAAGGVSEGRSVVTDAAGGAGGKSTVGTGSARPGSSGLGMGGGGGGGGGGQERAGGKKMEEETEVDILLARKRREANDRYFQRVNQGVLDVVSKLEEVAIAMRAVEQESKELWGDDNESIAGSTRT
ncbi:uncharacterized protein B0H64DRAFT_441195 [Chaetomium fimeti]|uniref:Uncharacterized protein n=1 Tax=Chaetomium fimeti TaxID=1854472 RepID=A0AAE0HJL2_9PEZI|nr:hypothetical protein B0H64DRAFT_441195 [Chaetomium fimeti]